MIPRCPRGCGLAEHKGSCADAMETLAVAGRMAAGLASEADMRLPEPPPHRTSKTANIAQRLRTAYDSLWIDCSPIAQWHAMAMMDAIKLLGELQSSAPETAGELPLVRNALGNLYMAVHQISHGLPARYEDIALPMMDAYRVLGSPYPAPAEKRPTFTNKHGETPPWSAEKATGEPT